MNRDSKIGAPLAVAAATCLAALAVLVPGAPAVQTASERGECRLPAWTHAVTGGWGRGSDDCR